MANTDPIVPLDSMKEDLCEQGTFRIGNTLYDVSLSQSSLSWTKKGGTSDTAVTVPIEEIVSVNSGLQGDVVALQTSGFTVCYVSHKKKQILRREIVIFESEKDDLEVGQKWCTKIQAAVGKVKERPRKLLVLVNPIGGSGNGKQIYETTVTEVFKQASIETEVLVTERAHHTEEILSHYDLTAVDGIALVGGDGMYHEAVNGLQHRLMKEADLNKNDPSTSLQPIPLPIGLIPAGTGNGIAHGCYGNADVETAALAIMIGKKRVNNIIGVHSQDELIGYAIIVVGYGFWGDMMYSAETHRHWGVMRYPAAILDTLLIKSNRQMDLSVEYLPPIMSTNENQNNPTTKTISEEQAGDQSTVAKESEDVTKEPAETEPNSDEKSTQWQSVQGIYSAACVTIGAIKSPLPETEKPLEEHTRLILNRPCGRLWSLWFFVKLMAREGSALADPVCEHMLVKEYRIKLNNPSDPESANGKLEHIISLDGEIFHLKNPEFIVRLHPKLVQLFTSSPEIWYGGC